MAQLSEGRGGLRLVGLGLIVPHVQWNNSEEWEEAFGKEALTEHVVLKSKED